ncbi:MAG: TIGR02206 family membrane protein [Verrucomicrobiota bacterium]
MPQPFQPFTQQHFITVVIGFAAVAAFLMAGKKGGDSRKRTTAVLALINLSSFPLSLAAWSTIEGPKSWDNFLPLQLCDIATLTAGFALITKRPLFCALTYFWGLAATMQALLTPALTVGFPHMAFVMFFVQHFAIVATAFYLPVVEGWRPRRPLWKAPLEVYFWSVIYLIVAMSANKLLGANFAFAAHPPVNPSLIDHLGPWPWYLLSMQGIAVVFFYLLTLPFAGRPKIDPP